MMQNLNLKRTQFFILKANYHICIYQKFSKKKDNRDLEEQNLNTVILLNPKNEEAIYMLAKLKLTSSDYQKSKELNKKLKKICNKFCNQSDKLKIEIENLSKK